MQNIAIIPARGGSKRIHQKNIKDFLGKPIIAYSIENAIESKLFKEVMVSTDNEEIAQISKKYGSSVPFLRSKNTSTDFAIISDVITEVLDNYKKTEVEFDYFCVIFATAPFVSVKKLTEGLEILIKNGFDSVISVVKYSYPIQRALISENNKLSLIHPENYEKRSQDLMPTYHDSGQFYWMKVNEFYKQKTLFSKNAGALIVPEIEVQDIDTIEDWELAELKYRLFKK